MKDILDWLKKPTTICSLLVFAFSLGWTWVSVNNRIEKLEEFHKTIDIIQLQTTLKEIQVDLTWIKSELARINNNNK